MANRDQPAASGFERDRASPLTDQRIRATLDGLRRIARRMLSPSDRLRRMVDSEDLVQEASLRYLKILEEQRPASDEEFWRLTSTLAYQALKDLARKQFGPLGHGANTVNVPHSRSGEGVLARAVDVHPSPGSEAGAAEAWQGFFQAVEELPGKERAVFDLLWLERLSQRDAAERLNVSERTIRAHWNRVRMKLGRYLKDCGLVE